MRTVVDTNVWVSSLLTPAGPPGQVRTALRDDRFTLIVSEPLIVELTEVLSRQRLRRKYAVAPEDVSDLVTLLRVRGEATTAAGAVHLCRDPKDDVFLETALNGRADVLVSRDDDLKRAPELAGILAEQGIKVLTVQRFLDALAEEARSGT